MRRKARLKNSRRDSGTYYAEEAGMTIRAIGIGLMFLALLGMQNGVHAADKVLRVAPHADLNVLDPPVSSAVITLMHGLMIYDTLFSWDAKLQPKPQMVETYQISPDRLVYTFTLRAGLKFHNGQPVTTGDVIPSLKRWMVRNTFGQMLATYVEAMEATDKETLSFDLSSLSPSLRWRLGPLIP
jgi:peptide/nickel transport system substrate-binding protein